MTQPTSYSPTTDFSQDESNAVSGRSTVRTPAIDTEFGNIAQTLSEVLANLAILQRDDTLMMNGILKGHEFSGDAISYLSSMLSASTGAVFVWRGDWSASGTDYQQLNLVHYGGSVYIGLTNHTSGATAPDADPVNWDLFASKGADSGLPSRTGNANKFLMTDGSTDIWSFLTNDNVSGITTDASESGVITVDFSSQFQHTMTLTENITSWVTTNRAAGKAVDIRIVADASGPYTFPSSGTGFGADWKWINGIPAQAEANKTAILSLRCYGTNESDVVASLGAEL